MIMTTILRAWVSLTILGVLYCNLSTFQPPFQTFSEPHLKLIRKQYLIRAYVKGRRCITPFEVRHSWVLQFAWYWYMYHGLVFWIYSLRLRLFAFLLRLFAFLLQKIGNFFPKKWNNSITLFSTLSSAKGLDILLRSLFLINATWTVRHHNWHVRPTCKLQFLGLHWKRRPTGGLLCAVAWP